MKHKQHIKSLNNFIKTYELEHCSLTLQIHTPINCSCGYPHAYIYITSNDCGDETLINDFSLSDKESYFNVISIVQMLTQKPDFYDDLRNDIEKFQKSLVESN